MFLCIDIGNSQIKMAWFDQDDLIDTQLFSCNDERGCDFQGTFLAIQQPNILKTIISSVINDNELLASLSLLKEKVIWFDQHIQIPLQNLYNTPETLGNDRLAAAVGANSLFPNKDLLVIDAGTCITYDFITKNGEYIGGSISPGIDIRLKSLHHFTEKLPVINFQDIILLTGTNTEESILSGIINGTIAEVDRFIELYRTQYPELQVVFTGGSTNFFEKRLKYPIFADPNLVVKGLHQILKYSPE